MDIVQAVLNARKEIPPVTADETATISGTKGSFKFKYASLQGLLEVVVPVLAKYGVLLTQHISTDEAEPNLVGVQTILRINNEDGFINSGKLYAKHDGSPRDMGSKATSLKRIQLISLLGIVVDDDDPQPQQYQQRQQTYQPQPQPPPRQQNDQQWEKEEPLRKAVMRGNAKGGRSTELETLIMRLRQADTNDATAMPTKPAEGKKVSMYEYLASLVKDKAGANADPQQVLSYLYGRVINPSTPPKMATKFLLDELQAGKHTEALAEASGKVLEK